MGRPTTERADNLLLRLFSYTPRQERTALEDYCTEALAWCLRQSPPLRTGFLKLTGIEALWRQAERVEVFTQVSFSPQPEDPEDEETDAPNRGGRFDLVFQVGPPQPQVLVVECKVDSDFDPEQLPKYRARLEVEPAFPGIPVPSRYLATLTRLPKRIAETDSELGWPQVQKLVADQAGNEEMPLRDFFQQLAEFLRTKNLAPLPSMKTDKATLNQYLEVKELEEQMSAIVQRLRREPKIASLFNSRQPVRPKQEWTGVDGISDGFWAGFGVCPADESGGRELTLWVEVTVQGDARAIVARFTPELQRDFEAARGLLKAYADEEAANFDLDRRPSRFVWTRRAADESDGDGEACLNWLVGTSEAAAALLSTSKQISGAPPI